MRYTIYELCVCERPNVGFCKWTWPGLLLMIDRNIQTRRKKQEHHFLSASKASITTTNNNNNNDNKKQTNQKHTATYLQKEWSNTQTQKLGFRAQKSKVPTSSAAMRAWLIKFCLIFMISLLLIRCDDMKKKAIHEEKFCLWNCQESRPYNIWCAKTKTLP